MVIPNIVTFENFTNADSAAMTCAELYDDEIIRQVSAAPSNGNYESEDNAPPALLLSHVDLVKTGMVFSVAYSDGTNLSKIPADPIACIRSSILQPIHDFFQTIVEPE